VKHGMEMAQTAGCWYCPCLSLTCCT
jgi:hypothetical protein